ncbi:MAG: TVP38/TMEM64 family protein [Candidatus Omnitrophota bacterium]
MTRAAKFSVVLGVVVAVWFVHRTGALERVLATIDAAGIWGPFIFLAVYVLACLFFVPFSIFTFSGGMLFGFWRGTALSVLGNGLGSVAAFWIGRYLARRWVERALAGNASLKKFSGALDQKGWKIVLLARLSPVFPFSIANYTFGTTRIPAWQYGAASMTGTVPSVMVCTYLGALTGDLSLFHSGVRPRMPAEWALLILGLIATVVLFFSVRNLARKALES